MPEPVVAAPAPPETITATRDAANRGDFNAFDKADSAARVGKPLAEVAAPEKPATPDLEPVEPPAIGADGQPPKLSRREREQNEINDRIRVAVDRATQGTQAELARLRAEISARPAPKSEASAPAPTPQAEHKRYLAMPGAPKLDQFDSIEEHAAAMAVFIADTRHEERETARQQGEQRQQAHTAYDARLSAFDARVAEANAKDATFSDRVRPISSQLQPTEDVRAFNAALARGEISGQPIAIGPLQSLADEILDSESSAALLDHFQQHPDDFNKFKTLRSPREVTRELAKIEARLVPAAAAAAPLPPVSKPKFISDAPPPAPIISTPHTSADPKASALARGDFATFDKLEMQDKVSQRQPASQR